MRKMKKGLLLAVLCGTMLNICACGAQNSSNPEGTTVPEVGTVAAITLRMREEASADSNVVGLLQDGQQVTIISDADEYYYIHVPSAENPDDILEGYVRKDYVKID